MSKRPSISTLVAGFASASQLNTIFTAILDAFDNTLSRDGSSPNAMNADIDLNSNDLLNVSNTHTDNLYVGGTKVTDATYVPNWEGAWVTSTSYVVNDTVRQDGNVYICLVAHTSGTFATDLTNNYWELFASKGSAGAGSGDLLAANNLSDVSDAATSRANLGLGSIATVAAPSGTVVGTTDTQTLTNKTLTAPAINGAVSGDSLATQAEAEAGTNNDQIMTPLRTLQAINNFTLGVDQTWSRVEGSRVFGTEYQNTSGRPIQVLIRKSTGTNDMSVYMGATSGALSLITAAPPVNYAQIGFIVPPEWYYRVESANSLQFWSELS